MSSFSETEAEDPLEEEEGEGEEVDEESRLN